ncbi:MAG: 4Fe-4S dicluster domain-containing protein [Dehalococcoidales bacterium]|nr:4Fe-4S dicluster domain-containing protein [Dehalococcoidales bacterium]
MATKNTTETGATPESKAAGQVDPAQSKAFSRRQFLKATGAGGVGLASLYLLGCSKGQAETKLAVQPTPTRQVFVPNATMMIVGDPTRCVGCRRCEIACTDYNEGKTQPSLARVKINRNYLFGPRGVQPGFWNAEGIFGNHRIIQDTCRQCPHPVPCLDACPNGAIEVAPQTNARVVNVDKCTGCKTCHGACPWAMTTFDAETKKASKCHLCGGDPQCVKACPTGALQYVPWTDRTREVPARFVPVVSMAEDVKATCITCHK